MTNGLNQQFINDPERFLSGCKSIDTAKTQHGSGYAIDANGIASLDMVAYSPSQVMVKQADGRFFSETPIRAYYLPSQVNQTMSMNLGSNSNFFFTDLITGCQFMAYGNNRHNLTVCHINALDEGAPAYERAAAGIRSHRFPIEIIHGPSQYRAGLSAVDGPNSVVTVVGWRRTDGWHFYARQCVNSPNNKFVVGTAATELLPARRY
jgi:hypothetical protein